MAEHRKRKNHLDHPDENDLRNILSKRQERKNVEHQSQKPNKHFGFIHLKALSDKEPSDIVFVINNKSNGFVDLFKQNKDPDWLFLIMKVTAKICVTEFSESKHYILSEMCAKPLFFDHLQSYILTTATEINEKRRENMGEFFENCLTVCESITELFLNTAFERLNRLVLSFSMAVSGFKINFSHVEINEAVITNKISKLLQQFTKLKSIETNNNDKNGHLSHGEPPENFRTLTLYPEPFDMKCEKPFLRPNITKGAYQSVEHYLDVQFRLLREDFVRPLREAVICYRDNQKTVGERRKRINNIRVYRNVTFEKNKEFVDDKLGCLVNFNRNNKLKINWNISKRLMYGSLILFTADEFDSFFVGIVMNRDKKYLENGQVIVEMIHGVPPETTHASLTMVESEVYYEPYKCAMQVLKKMNDNNFPMAKYFVAGCTEIDRPAYLRGSPDRKYHFKNVGIFNVLDDTEWPTEDQFGFDEMQYRAFKAAITNELAVIQGPPGTGKTFIGLKIMEIIISNMLVTKLTKPILVVCYTNHALDQFMEGILEFTKNVVRIGGQTKSQKINDYTLRNLKLKASQRTHRPAYTGVQDLTKAVGSIMHNINYLKKCKEFISENTGVLEWSLLKTGMPNEHHDFFNDDPKKYIDWLFFDIEHLDFNPVYFLMNQALFPKHDQSIPNVETCETDFNKTVPEIENSVVINYRSDIIVYSITLASIKTIYEETIERLNNTRSKRMKFSRGSRSNYYDIVRGLEIECYNIGRLYDYFVHMLALAKDNNSYLPVIPMNLFKLSMRDRWLLYFRWVNNTKNYFDRKILNFEKHYTTVYKRFSELKEIENIDVLKNKRVVGMTTTGASKHRALLEGLQSPIVIVEEAAEVLEAHIIASLTRHCQHLILIGDHKQLRPSTANFKLAKDYHFDVSLFERLVNSGVPYYSLGVQHRMRPEVSSLIKPVIYPVLSDHVSVLGRPHIRGVTKDLFFLDHKNFETEVEEISSKSNDHEASFLISFARHLILQGYKPDQVTILTTYSGQMFKLRSLQNQYSNLDEMKIQVVDNYQGEESDIILLSLVRSNEDGKVGFLKTENRVCVALSRAKNGLYIMGNMDNLYNSGRLWKEIKQKLVDQEAYGEELTLQCAIHPVVLTKVSKSEDFVPILEGGCTTMCNTLMNCGHYCSSICHTDDREHQKKICQNPCNKVCSECSHPCEKKCYEKCGNCIAPVSKKLPCGHQATRLCFEYSEEIKCEEKVDVVLEECGHKLTKYCHEKNYNCMVKCIDRLECGHPCILNCHKNNDPEHEKYVCMKPCAKINKMCSENHPCKQKCYEECSLCTIKVDKKLKCGHLKIKVNCSDNIESLQCSKHLPCNRKLQCGHKCLERCYQTCKCKFFITKIYPECGHSCNIKCKNNPDRKTICSKKCTRTLSCGHECNDICGNECSSEKCKQLVLKEDTVLICGHRKLLMPCCDINKELNVNSQDVLNKCEEPCLEKLLCGDICSGTCGKCKQGRLHVPCAAKCKKINPCNHTCNYPCKSLCPPCDQPCSYSCTHSKCSRKCGAPCVPCQEPCVWKCVHFTCSNKCSEFCNRPPCYKPCEKKLKCNHKCIGFCGEPCPPLCRECNKDEVTNIVYGNEDEPDARFVYLEDCKHTIESKAMEQWLNQNDGEIALKHCPACKVPVVKTLRFKRYTKTAHNDICEIKRKLYGDSSSVQKAKTALLRSVRDLNGRFACDETVNSNFEKLRRRWRNVAKPLMGSRSVDRMSAKAVESWTFAAELTETFFTYASRIRSVSDDRLKNELVDHYAWLLTAAFECPERLSDQQKSDLNLETLRGCRLVRLYGILTSDDYRYAIVSDKFLRESVDRATALLTYRGRYDAKRDAIVRRSCDEALKKVKSVATTAAERRMINAAMAKSFHGGTRAQGHWLKCVNGHIYCVTECGGPMQKSQCPVDGCGAAIGGVDHRYAEGTTVASEMDGARHVAWSAANEINNYVME